MPTSEPGATIVLYEDDWALAREIVFAFQAENLAIQAVSNRNELVAIVAAGRAAVLIMDRMIGDFDSLEIIGGLRAAGERVPVVIISSRATVDDRIVGLKRGGDDYLVKPFAMGELIARVEALVRRAENIRATRLKVGPLVLDCIERSVRQGNRDIILPPREFSLLEYLMRHAGQVVTRAMLLEHIWNFKMPPQTNVVDVHVSNLRRKIESAGEERLILSVPGLGFKIEANGPSHD